MRKLLLGIVMAALILTGIVIAPAGSIDPADLTAVPLPMSGSSIVRVYFDDLDTAHRLAASIEPLEAHYETGYLVFEVDNELYRQLVASGFEVEIDAARTQQYAQLASGASIQSIPGFSCYRTVEETFATAQDIANNFPNLATWTDVGDSWEKVTSGGQPGYDMQVLRLTNSAIPGPKPKIFITSAIHAREYATAELTTRFAEQLVNGYGTDPDATWILDYHEIHFMLHTNPDGRKQAETGILWRKNTNQNYCSPTSNNRGADLNRNFPFNWGCCGGSSGSQCSETYRGASPASEPETQAVVNYIQSNFVDARGPNESDPAPLDTEGIYLDIHSSGRLLLWPWGHTSSPAPNGTQLQTLGRKLAYFNGHTPEQSIGLYPTDGTTTSFAYGEMGLAAFTFELGTEFFQSCNYFQNTLLPDNLPALAYAVKVVRSPYITPAGPDALSLSLSAGSSSPGVPGGTVVTLNATMNDTRYNNSNGTEPTQDIAAAEYYIDTPPWEAGASANAMSASDGNFNTSIEGVTASVDTTGLSLGRHTVFVRGQDDNGNWGAVSAIFLWISDGSTPTPTSPPPPTNTPTPLPGNVVFFDDFESSQGWTTNPGGTDTATTGQWERANPETTSTSGNTMQLGTTVSGSFDLVTEGTAGSSVGTNDIDNGVTSIRSPNINLPVSGNIALSFSYYLAHLNNATSADFLRVSVVGSTTQVVFEELGAGNTDVAVWDSTTVSLSSFSGQTIYLLIEAADASSGSLVEAAVDDVEITADTAGPTNTPTPIPPTATNTPIPPTATDTPIPPTATDTPIPPTATNTPEPGADIFFDDFETDQGWTTNPGGTDTATTGQWERANPETTSWSGDTMQLGTTVSGSFDLVTEGSAGSSVGANDIDGGVTSIRSPNISLPSSGNLTLEFSYYLGHLGNASSADFIRVTVVGSSSSVVLEELGTGSVQEASWQTVSTSLNSFAGQTVYILIEAADAGSGSLVEAGVDDVRITNQ